MGVSKDKSPRRALCVNIKNNKKNKEFYKYIDNQCWLAKNIYNKGMYDIRQLFIATQKINKGLEITEEQQAFVNNFYKWLEVFNNNIDIKNEEILKRNVELEKQGKKIKPLQKHLVTKTMLGGEYIPNEILVKYIEEGSDYISLKPVGIVKGKEVVYGGDIPRGVLREVLSNDWNAYFESMKAWFKNPSNFTGKPKLPRYKNPKHGRTILFLNNDLFQIKDGYIVFTPASGMSKFSNIFKVNLGDFKGRKYKENKCNAKCIKFVPKNGYYQLMLSYSIGGETSEEINKRISSNRVVSIDMGVNRLATVANNIGLEPFAINGKPLKSINNYWNKERARLQSILKKVNGKDYSKKLETLTNKRNARIKHHIHLATAYIIKWCNENQIDTVVIGKNDGWKKDIKKDGKLQSDKVRQQFTNIPFNMLINQLAYKCESNGIKFVETEESYTSGTSFLDNEEPTKENYEKTRRKFRGLFVSNKGELIHADLNGAYQIGKKLNSEFFIKSENYRHPKIITLGS